MKGIKRDGSKVKWNSNKIVNAIRKAFESCKEEDKFNENEFKEFTNATDLANCIIQGFRNNTKVPDEVSEQMESILTSGKYSSFD